MSLEEIIRSFINTTDNIAAPPLNSDMLKHLEEVMGAKMMLRVIQMFLHDTPQQLAALRHSAATGNIDTLRQQAHHLKGESLQIGANRLGVLCEQMERVAQQGQIEAVPANLAEIETELARVTTALAQVGNL